MLRTVLVASFLLLTAVSARADSCSTVVPGAQMGPSPNFNSWPWQNACYVSWPGGSRQTYEAKCQQVKGFLHFEGDYGSNKNTCIFKAEQRASSQAAAPAAPAAPAARAEVTKSEPPIQYKPWRSPTYDPDSNWDRDVPAQSNWKEANEKIEKAKELYRKEMYTVTEISFLSPLRDLSNADEGSTKMRRYLKCMSAISLVFKKYYRDKNFDDFNADDVYGICQGVVGELSSEGVERVTKIHREMGRTPPPDPRQIVSTLPAQETIDTRCLVIREPRDTGVGCGNGKTWKMTHVAVSTVASNACPSSMKFFYDDEDGPEIAEAPTKLQTCGAPPLNVRTRK